MEVQHSQNESKKNQFSTENKYPAGFIHPCVPPKCSKLIFNFLPPRDYRQTGAAVKLLSGSRRSREIHVNIEYKTDVVNTRHEAVKFVLKASEPAACANPTLNFESMITH